MATISPHAISGFTPDSLADQIAELEKAIERTQHYYDKLMDAAQLHPSVAAARMHRLRSALWTLEEQQLRGQT